MNGIIFITDRQKGKPISRFERPSIAMLFVTEQKQFLGLICFQICKEKSIGVQSVKSIDINWNCLPAHCSVSPSAFFFNSAGRFVKSLIIILPDIVGIWYIKFWRRAKGPGSLKGLVKLWMSCLFLVFLGNQLGSKADQNPHATWHWGKYPF